MTVSKRFPLFPGAYPERRRQSESTARETDTAVRGLVHIVYKRTSKVLTKHRGNLEVSAKLLLQQETLSVADLPVTETWDERAG